MEITAKAYGKILVFGAYAILEPGNIGLVVNTDKGTTSKVTDTKSGRIIIDLASFDITLSGNFDGESINSGRNIEVTRFIKSAVENTFKFLNSERIRLMDIKLVSKNDPEMCLKNNLKTGFGSSATAVVSAVAGVLALHEIDKKEIVYKIARYSHFTSQGNLGSGFDISAACYGSHYFMSKENKLAPDFSEYIKAKEKEDRLGFEWPSFFNPVIIFTGQAASTINLVAKVLEYKAKKPDEYLKIMQEYNTINLQTKQAFDENNIDKIKAYLEKSWAMRKTLGIKACANIEEEKFTKLIDDLKSNGAISAGLVGAGGGDSILALCKSNNEAKRLIDYAERHSLYVFEDVNIANKPYEVSITNI